MTLVAGHSASVFAKALVQRGVRHAVEGLDDDVAFGDIDREQLGRDACDNPAIILEGALAGHRGRSADALEVLWREPLPDASYKQRDVRALPSTVRVELIQDEEPQSSAVSHDASINFVLTGHQELKHHEVGEQDVGRVLGNPTSRLGIILIGVSIKRDRFLIRDVSRARAYIVESRIQDSHRGYQSSADCLTILRSRASFVLDVGISAFLLRRVRRIPALIDAWSAFFG